MKKKPAGLLKLLSYFFSIYFLKTVTSMNMFKNNRNLNYSNKCHAEKLELLSHVLPADAKSHNLIVIPVFIFSL
jgi:hypothetical protein